MFRRRTRSLQILLSAAACSALGCAALDSNTGPNDEKADQGCTQIEHTIDLELDMGQREFNAPVAAVPHPSDPGRWYVVEQRGIVWTTVRADGLVTPRRFVDVRSRVDSEPAEAGLFSIALHPDFDQNGEAFLSYTATDIDNPSPSSKLVSRISRFRSLDGGLTLDADSEEILLSIQQPFNNHNGGQIAFGPDGMLYIGMGDGGSGGDPLGKAQNPNELLGKVLRIDVDNGDPFAIPADNPFASGGGRPEIYATGLRNPWRFSFDTETGALWLGDVGQDAFEEVNIITLGGNYGWNEREGESCFGSSVCADDFQAPVATYGRDEGVSISGGFVYRGSAMPDLVGSYVFADFANGTIYALKENAVGEMERSLLRDTTHNISGFGQDLDGEMFAISWSGGGIYKLVPGTVEEICPDATVSTPDPNRVMNFQELYDEVISVDCAPCHTQRALGGLRMLDVDTAFENLIDVSAETTDCLGRTRVIAGDADNSLLFSKVSGVNLCGPQMPLGLSMSGENIEHIRKWIEAGAQR